MLKAIQKVVEENLPKAVASELLTYLQKAEQQAKDFEALKVKSTKLNETKV
jgi:hypothetical protein